MFNWTRSGDYQGTLALSSTRHLYCRAQLPDWAGPVSSRLYRPCCPSEDTAAKSRYRDILADIDRRRETHHCQGARATRCGEVEEESFDEGGSSAYLGGHVDGEPSRGATNPSIGAKISRRPIMNMFVSAATAVAAVPSAAQALAGNQSNGTIASSRCWHTQKRS